MGGRRAKGGGRKPLPTAIKLLRGNAGKRKLADEAAAEAQLEHGIPNPPRHLDATERRRWFEMGAELDKLGVLAKTDRTSLAMLVRARVRWERCGRKVAKLAEVLEDANGKLYRNPWAIAEEQAWRQLFRMCVEFGVTPASRTKVGPVAGRGAGTVPEAPPAGANRDPGVRFFGT